MRIWKRLTPQKIISIAFFALVLSCCIYFFSNKFFEKDAYDALTKLTSNRSGLSNIVHVVIDDVSIKEISNWPWARTYYADMFEYLEKYSNARIIGFDAVLNSKADAQNDKEFLTRLTDIKNLVAGVDFSKNINDKNNPDELKVFENKFSINVVDNRTPKYAQNTTYNAYRGNFPSYLDKLNTIASVNTVLDTDGTVRAFEPVVLMNGKYYPSLPLGLYLKLNPAKEIVLYDNKYEIFLEDGTKHTFPLFRTKEKSVQYIKWLAPYDNTSWIAHKQFNAADVIKSYQNVQKGEPPIISPAEFNDKIVIIGATANALYDLKITPLTINMPGNAIQATALDNLLTGQNIKIVPTFVNCILIFLFSILIFILVFYFVPIISIISIFFLGFVYFYLLLFSFSHGFALNIVAPYIFFVLTAILSYSYKFTVEDYKKEKLKRAMKKYINTNVVDDIIKNTDEEVKLGGKKTEMTILMADIRGFTKMSEPLEPDEVTALLNEYFGAMIPIIEEYKGAVNKFIGDAILAVFNEPIKDIKHPQNAILCATKMIEKHNELRKKWKSEGKTDIGISIGINTGSAFIGNIGTPNHMEYTVIGDTVNVASRIESQNRQFNTQLLISESTYEYAKDILDVIKISSVAIKGREKHIDIYEIINIIDKDEIN